MKYNPKVVLAYFKICGIPEPVLELQFHPERRWRFDFAWPESRLALEVQGGLFIQGGHTRGAALRKEHEKLNHAAMDGWRLMFTEPKFLCARDTVTMIKKALTTADYVCIDGKYTRYEKTT